MRAATSIHLAGALIVSVAAGLSAGACTSPPAAPPADAQAPAAAQADAQAPGLSGLAKALMSPDGVVREKATKDLFRLGRVPPAAWPSLRMVYAIEDVELRTEVALSLGRSGDTNGATVGALIELLELVPQEQYEAIRSLEASGAVLASITRSGGPAYSVHVLSDGAVVYFGYRFVKVAGYRGSRLAPAQLDALVGAFQAADYFSLADRYPFLTTDAPSAGLWFSRNGRTKTVDHNLSNPGPEALQRLERRFEEIVGSQEWVGTSQERDAARAGVAGLPALMERLADSRLRARRLAARQLYEGAAGAPEPQRSRWQRAASVVLAEALADPDEGLRYQAILSLQGDGVLAPEAVAALVKGLGDPSTRMRYRVYERLSRAGPVAQAAVPVLLEQLGRPKSFEWSQAAEVLGRIGAAARPAVPALARGLRKGEVTERAAAAFALGGIGPAASRAVPALKVALADPDPVVRQAAAAALQAIRRR